MPPHDGFTCTSAASPGPPPIRWLGFRFRNCRTKAEGQGLGQSYGPSVLRWARGRGRVTRGLWVVVGALEYGLPTDTLRISKVWSKGTPFSTKPLQRCLVAGIAPRANSWGYNLDGASALPTSIPPF